MPDINIDDPASILSAIPAVLGFHPQASIVVILISADNGAESVHSMLRFDIDINAARKLTTVAAPAFRNVAAAILVAICGDWIAGHAATVLDVVRDSLAQLNIATRIRLTTPTLDQPAHWTNIDAATRGPVTPFDRTAFAAETVYSGKRIATSRDEILAEFTPATNPAPILRAAPADIVVDTFETVAAIISGTARLERHSDLATRVAILITDVRLRDAALRMSIDHADAAAVLWTQLANHLTGTARIDTLTLAAGCYYAAADGVRAGIALDVAATEANAAHLDYPQLAQMLLSALQAGLPPAQIRAALAAAGHRDT
ncbi:DUF4192 domain-containing protein [Mycobacterium kyorinense]|uniref:DUF4192 domain-containing protein n=1 Tax=Mycobacterium kyorinense TaxID=487514 RepID=A0A1X1YHV6_9MYCO|nr:DUF4192 domain-containing protein [Mycobacterium kyorinense]ORW10601.1 hypothetical protein AWC14_20110 [Mycobacterium kyorinense]